MVRSTMAVIGVLLCTASIALAQPPTSPPLADLRDLQLTVEKAEVVDRVTIGDDLTKKALPGYRLWVVTLRGVIPRPCRVSLIPASFSAVWEREELAFGTKEMRAHVTAAENLRAGDRWVATMETSYAKALPEEHFVFLVTLPEDVSTFRVTYGTFAAGVARPPGG